MPPIASRSSLDRSFRGPYPSRRACSLSARFVGIVNCQWCPEVALLQFLRCARPPQNNRGLSGSVRPVLTSVCVETRRLPRMGDRNSCYVTLDLPHFIGNQVSGRGESGAIVAVQGVQIASYRTGGGVTGPHGASHSLLVENGW